MKDVRAILQPTHEQGLSECKSARRLKPPRSLRRRNSPSLKDFCVAAVPEGFQHAPALVSSPHRFEGTEPMPTSFRECRDDEFMLLPVDMRDWLPEGHLAYLIRDMVREMDLSPFYLPYDGDGCRNRPYEPRMMVTVLIYAYATGVFSSRRIARRLHEDVAFRMLCGGSFPRHRTDLRVPPASSRRLPSPVP